MAAKDAPPSIESNVVYPLETVRQNWFPGKRAWLEARKRGLDEVVFYIGRRGFVNGSDLVEKMQTIATRRPSTAQI